MSNTAGLQSHPLPLGGARGLHSETVSRASSRPRRHPSCRGHCVRPFGRSGPHGAWVRAEAGPREHWAPVVSSAGRARSQVLPAAALLPGAWGEEAVGAEQEDGAGRRSPPLGELSRESAVPPHRGPAQPWPCHSRAVCLQAACSPSLGLFSVCSVLGLGQVCFLRAVSSVPVRQRREKMGVTGVLPPQGSGLTAPPPAQGP